MRELIELYRRLLHSLLYSSSTNYIRHETQRKLQKVKKKISSQIFSDLGVSVAGNPPDGRKGWWMGSNDGGKSVAEGREGRGGSKGNTACGLRFTEGFQSGT